MFYEVKPNTETFSKLTDFKKRFAEVEKAANEVLKQFGGKKIATLNRRYGGIDGIVFDENPDPKKWKSVGEKYMNLFYPKASNKKDCLIIESLPTISHKEPCDIIGLSVPQTFSSEAGLHWIDNVGLAFSTDKKIGVHISQGAKFDPSEDLIEITETQFVNIKKEITDSQIN